MDRSTFDLLEQAIYWLLAILSTAFFAGGVIIYCGMVRLAWHYLTTGSLL